MNWGYVHNPPYPFESELSRAKSSEPKWTTLSHNGVMLPPPYQKHNTPVLVSGREVILDQESEEAATFFARWVGSDHMKNPIFLKNFWNDWSKILRGRYGITSLESVDFSRIVDYLEDQRVARLEDTGRKEREAQRTAKYRIAIVDGKEQAVGNFAVDPPGIFMGRGKNPKSGKIKKRLTHQDVTINIGEEAPVPPGNWGAVINDHSVEWLASWLDDITGKTKYVWLKNDSEMKMKGDESKFELARKLKRKISGIRTQIDDLIDSTDEGERQLGTVLHFIDKLSIRVGGEKAADTADTVGATTLKVKNIKLKNDQIVLDFLGKDSVQYKKVFTDVTQIYRNIHQFTRNKNPNDQLFDLVTPAIVNAWLQKHMEGLTAKVFRTFNASMLFQKQLKAIEKKMESYSGSKRTDQFILQYQMANGKVAELCNHQKNVGKNHQDDVQKIKKQISELKKKIKAAKKSEQKEKMRDRVAVLKTKLELKKGNCNISLGTSKASYIDPRITYAFAYRNDLPIEKLFTKTLREKFAWASSVPGEWMF